MKSLFKILLLLITILSLHAEVVSYKHGDTIDLPCVASLQPVPGSLRTLILVNETKLSVKGTWDSNDLDMILNGNTVRVNLKQNKTVPIGILGSSGIYYYVLVKPVTAASGAQLSPTIQVIGDQGAAPGTDSADRRPQDRTDPGEKSGGRWEHTTNSVIRLHKHIRGGRPLSTVAGQQQFNEEILRTEKRRVPGKVWTQADDWQSLEYYSWSLNNVTAHYVGITYLGRDDEVDFEYLKQQTDRTLCIWHQRRAGDDQLMTILNPKIRLRRGQEEYFLVYTKDAP